MTGRAPATAYTTTPNLWQQNMFAVRAEFRAGFVVRDIADFRKLTDGASA